MLGKIKQNFPKKNIRSYIQLDRHPGSFSERQTCINEDADELPFWSITSNINTATYKLACYLANTVSLLSCSEFTVSSSKKFTDLIWRKYIPNNS